MGHPVFSTSWAEAFGEELRASQAYRQAASSWEGAIVLAMTGDAALGVADDREVFLDLWHGDCRNARVASEADSAAAEFVIRAKAKVWKKVLEGRLEPMWGLMSGQLKLARGSLARITPYVKASKELLAAAQRLDSVFGELEAAPSVPTTAELAAGSATTAQNGAGATSAAAHDGSPTGNGSVAGNGERVFQTTSPRGLNHDLPPMRLWRKSKQVGIWDPESIDFSQDRSDWQNLDERHRDVLLQQSSLFQAGEESVALDLLPLIGVVAAEGRLEEEMYLTAFLWEEAKHVELFRRFLDEVAGNSSDLTHYHSPSYKAIFYDALPNALGRLRHDPSPVAQAEASVTYNMIVEGVLAETGYHAYHAMLERHQLMPGMMRAVAYLKADESRHMAYGVYLLSRLVAEHGDEVWRAIENRMGELLPLAIGVVNESFERYDEPMPFGLRLEEFTGFAMSQFERRAKRIEKARWQTLAEIQRAPSDSATTPQRVTP